MALRWVLSLTLAFQLVVCVPTPGSYFTDQAARRLVHFDRYSGDCKLFGDRRIVEEILRELADSDAPVAVLEATELSAIITKCSKGERQDKHPGSSSPKNYPHVIYPGTKWCGDGNVAESVDDLGELKDLDMCCRDHDFCDKAINNGETKFNLTNDTPFTISHCNCDAKFRKCLKSVQSPQSEQVGTAFFTTGLFRCFNLTYPITSCNKWNNVLVKACQDYTLDTSAEPKYQFFDLKQF